jgi:hypothetical protein
MRVVLIDRWATGHQASSPARSLFRAIWQSHQRPETRIEDVTEKWDRSGVNLLGLAMRVVLIPLVLRFITCISSSSAGTHARRQLKKSETGRRSQSWLSSGRL